MKQRSPLNDQRSSQQNRQSAILLTGCAGFIGSHLLDRLLAQGHTVIGVDDFNDYYSTSRKRKNIEHNLSNPNFHLIKKNICELKAENILPTLNVQRSTLMNNNFVVIHLAARAGVRASISQPLLYKKVNVGGTLSLLELAKKLRVKHFIFGGSSSVYGNNTPVPFQEDAPCDQPISPYAATKRGAELLCFSYHHLYKIPTTILRFFTVYGPRNRPDMAAFKFTDAIANGRPIDIYGKGTSRDYTYIDDITSGIMAALKFKNPRFNIINLGNSSPVSLGKFIKTIETVVGKKAILHPQTLPPGDVNATYADISRAKKLLNWQPKTSLQEGISKLWNWYKMNI